MFKLKLGVFLSEEYKKNISKGKQEVLYYYFGKKKRLRNSFKNERIIKNLL